MIIFGIQIDHMKLTGIIEQGGNGWLAGQIEEIPAVISQGETISELKENLIDALNLFLEVQKDLTDVNYVGKNIIREDLVLA